MARPPIERRIAAQVRRLREDQGLSQAELARLARTSRSQVAAVESGEKSPSIATVEAFARALGVSIALLIDEAPGETHRPDEIDRLATTLRARGGEYVAAVERIVTAMDRVAMDRGERGARRK